MAQNVNDCVQQPTDAYFAMAEKLATERRENTFRWGTRMLRGGGWNYNPCVLDRTGWENYYLSLPLDYDIRNDPVFNLKRSTYKRLGDLGFTWPEPSTRESMRTGYCGPDDNSLSRPGILRLQANDNRPEPAYRLHLTDRTSLHHLRADPLEGVIPFGRQGDMLNAKSVAHQDYKWRRSCCAVPKGKSNPSYDTQAYRLVKSDLNRSTNLLDRVVKCDDDPEINNFVDQPLIKLKKAWNWPINPITREPLGGRLLYFRDDPCVAGRREVWPCGEKEVVDTCNPMVIPDQRCELLAHGKKDKSLQREIRQYNASYLDMRFPTPNWECWEEVPEGCNQPSLPANCCFNRGQTKGPDGDTNKICPLKPDCPKNFF